jgi:autotransporter-associated beta strand protein
MQRKRTNRAHASALLARPYLNVFAVMLALSVLEVGAQAKNIDEDTTIPSATEPATQDFGPSDVNIATGHGNIVTLTIDSGGTVTSTGSWHVGQASAAQGNIIVNTGGKLVTEVMRLGDSDAAQGTLDINGGLAVITPSHPQDLAAVLLGSSENGRGIVNIHNGGELQTTGLSFGEPPEGPTPTSASLTLDNGTIRALEDNPDFITHSAKAPLLTTTLDLGGGIINTPAITPEENVHIIINSPFTGPGSLTKLGPGTLMLTNETSDYSGGTNLGAFTGVNQDTINGGVLIAASPNVLGTGDVHLIHGTLATASFVPSGPTAKGFPAPTGVASTINIHGNLTTEVNSTTALGLGGTRGRDYDHLHVDGNTTLKGGTLFVASLKNFQPVAGDAFAVIQHTNPNPAQTTVFSQPGFTEVDDLSLNRNGNLHPLVFYLPNAVLLVYATEPSNIKLTAETEEREQQELRNLPAVPRTPPTPPTTPNPPDNKPPGPPNPLPPPETDPGGPSTPGEEQQEHQEEQRALQFVSNQLLPRLTLNDTVPQSFLVRLFDPTAEELTSLYQG